MTRRDCSTILVNVSQMHSAALNATVTTNSELDYLQLLSEKIEFHTDWLFRKYENHIPVIGTRTLFIWSLLIVLAVKGKLVNHSYFLRLKPPSDITQQLLDK